MLPRQITHQNIFRVLILGFSLVILLLLAAAVVGIRNIHLIQQNAGSMVRDQGLTNRLIDELHSQQTSLTEVFSVLARDPDSIDYDGIQEQLDAADKDIERISTEGAGTPEKALWKRLQETSGDFSTEARRILAQDSPESYTSMALFRDHEAFIAVVARLIETQYRKVSNAQAQINKRSSSLLEASLLFASTAVLLALIFAGATVRMATHLIRGMEWQTAELGRVSFHMLEDQEATARRFSHELHDELGQSLTAVKTNLSALHANAGADSERLADCLHLVDEAIGNVRQMSQLLRPTILDDFGLAAGLRWLSEGFAQRTGIEVTCEATFDGRLPDETETHLFRIAQEALTNVARHASAKHVGIELTAEGNQVRLAIGDDGCGLDAAATNSHGLGLIGMRARARSAGGDVEVRSRAGAGVLIEVRVPLGDETHTNPIG
jgi:two-component system sensor histidine kinase UhpB